jgi:Xaa-Pro aminopeptidase
MQMYNEAINAVRPGVKANEVYEIAKRVAREAGYEEYFVHVIGHGLGLDEHDPPMLESEPVELVTSMVHSIEPGLYVPGVGGIRIEDTVLVTDTGRRPLTSFDKSL